jgi:hypothetical protein
VHSNVLVVATALDADGQPTPNTAITFMLALQHAYSHVPPIRNIKRAVTDARGQASVMVHSAHPAHVKVSASAARCEGTGSLLSNAIGITFEDDYGREERY